MSGGGRRMQVDQQKGTQLAEILGYVGEELDIPEDVYQDIRRRYMDLGGWLKADHLEHYQSDAEIYPQGSLRLGTAVRPVKEEDEYDVDLVYRRDIQKESTTQEELKRDLEEQLKRYLRYLADGGSEVPELVPGRRCWTLDYRGQFHMDILPALPDDEAAEHNRRDAENGIIIPDTAKEKPQKGTVVAVGPGTSDEKMEVKKGDVVLYGKYSGTDLTVDGNDFLIMKQSDILAII